MTSKNSPVIDPNDVHVNNLMSENDMINASTKKCDLLTVSYDDEDISDQAVANAAIATTAYKWTNNANKNNKRVNVTKAKPS